MISLPQNCKGKELVLEFYPTLKVNVEYWVEDILFADYTSFMRLQFFDWLPQNIITILCLFIGLLMITASLIIIKTKKAEDFGILDSLLFSLAYTAPQKTVSTCI